VRIGLFTVILALLLSIVTAPADKPTVIKDPEAIQYIGKEVEVRGRVVSVTTSPLGTTFINFGGEYPNQKFAGFIATRIVQASLVLEYVSDLADAVLAGADHRTMQTKRRSAGKPKQRARSG
jgi:hypothetical protein